MVLECTDSRDTRRGLHGFSDELNIEVLGGKKSPR